MNKDTEHSEYRPEIDGLRALSVLAVVANHTSNNTFANGFIGVDIFFVISGYVITGSVTNRHKEPISKFLAGFYARRIKRLYPGLLLVTLATSIFTVLLVSKPMIYLQTGFTSLIGISNFFLLSQESDYFAASTKLNPFSHTWSLGVEEQFYLVFPVLFWLSQQTKNYKTILLNTILVAITSWSFVKFVQEPSSSIGAHYLPQFRAWEIALGSLIFSVRSKKTFQHIEGKNVHNLALIVLVSLLFGWGIGGREAQITSVILTCILLYSRQNLSGSYRILTSSSVTHIGVLSYLIYLFHQPILTLSNWTIGSELWFVPFKFLAIYLLADFSHRFIERPIATSKFLISTRRAIACGLLSGLTLCLILFSLWRPLLTTKATSYYLFLGDHDSVVNDPIIDYVDKSSGLRADSCHTSDRSNDALSGKFTLTSKFLNNCFWLSDKDSSLFAFVGDSHTLSFFPLASQFWRHSKTSRFFLSRDGCAFPSIGPTSRAGCDEVMTETEEFLLQEMRRNRKTDVIIVTSRLLSHFTFKGDHSNQFGNGGSSDSVTKNWSLYLSSLSELATELKKSSDVLIITAPLPEFKGLDSENCSDQWFRVQKYRDKSCFGSNRESLLQQRHGITDQLQSLKNKHTNMFVFDVFEQLCPELKVCEPKLGGQLMFGDSNHLTSLGSTSLEPFFYEFLNENNLLR